MWLLSETHMAQAHAVRSGNADEVGKVTALLKQLGRGNLAAISGVVSLLYADLEQIARMRLRKERPDHTLEPAALVNSFLIQWITNPNMTWENRNHFLASASQQMRRVLIDYARARTAQKRGGESIVQELTPEMEITSDTPEQLLRVNELLDQLAAQDARMAKVVEMRCFGGMTHEEIGGVLHIDCRTVKRDWQVAKAWFRNRLL